MSAAAVSRRMRKRSKWDTRGPGIEGAGERRIMESIKKRMVEIIKEQPDDSSYDEILRELAFERMVERGIADSDAGRIISNQEMERRIRTWQK